MNFSPLVNKQQTNYHVPVKTIFNIKSESKQLNPVDFRSRLYEKADWGQFENELDRYMIDIEPKDSLDSFSKQIANRIISAADKGIPLSSLNIHKNEKYPENILQLIRYKKFLNKRFDKNKNEVYGQKLIEIRLIIGESIEELKRSQWRKFIEQMGPNPLTCVPFWRRLNRLRH